MLAIIQARMSSSRLPGKVLMDLCGHPILEWILDRVSSLKEIENLVVATSTDQTDDVIADFCIKKSISCFRGSLDNVVDRFICAITTYDAPEFIRINGDSPLIDPSLIKQGIDLYKSAKFDLVTNVLERTYPKGQSVEIIRASTFKKMSKKILTDFDREHVTSYFYAHPELYQIHNFRAQKSFGEVQLSVDTKEDFFAIRSIIEKCNYNPRDWQDMAIMRQFL